MVLDLKAAHLHADVEHMSAMSRLLLGVVLVVSACTTKPVQIAAEPPPPAAAAPTHLASTPASTAASTTTTTAPPATVPALRELDYPTDPNWLEDLPEPLIALAGAPAPSPNLAIDGPEDIDRWVAEVTNWAAWAQANPQDAQDHVDDVYKSGSPGARSELENLDWHIERLWFTLGWPYEPLDSGIEADDLADQRVTIDVAAGKNFYTYKVDEFGAVEEVNEPAKFMFLVRYTATEMADGQWRIVTVESLPLG